MMLSRLDVWHKTKQGYLTFGLGELLLCYIIGSLAINNGSLLFYTATLVLLYGGMRNLIKLADVQKAKHGKKSTSKKTA